MAAKTTEFVCHVLVATTDGSQEPRGFMAHVYGHGKTNIEGITCDVKSRVEKMQGGIFV
jgi:hypothetical protein